MSTIKYRLSTTELVIISKRGQNNNVLVLPNFFFQEQQNEYLKKLILNNGKKCPNRTKTEFLVVWKLYYHCHYDIILAMYFFQNTFDSSCQISMAYTCCFHRCHLTTPLYWHASPLITKIETSNWYCWCADLEIRLPKNEIYLHQMNWYSEI